MDPKKRKKGGPNPSEDQTPKGGGNNGPKNRSGSKLALSTRAPTTRKGLIAANGAKKRTGSPGTTFIVKLECTIILNKTLDVLLPNLAVGKIRCNKLVARKHHRQTRREEPNMRSSLLRFLAEAERHVCEVRGSNRSKQVVRSHQWLAVRPHLVSLEVKIEP